MALVVCGLLDARSDAAVRALWRRLEDAGVPTLASHTHGRHLPHLSWAALRSGRAEEVLDALGATRGLQEPVALHLDALGTFRRSRCWLAPAVTSELVERHRRVVDAVTATGAGLHRHYEPGSWVPHVTLAPRLHLDQLATVAAAVYAVLPVEAVTARTVLVDTTTGTVHDPDAG